jgi:hypothetical protein
VVVTFLLLLLCLASVAGVGGILWMLFGPTGPLFAPSTYRMSYAGIPDFAFEEHVHVAPPSVDIAPRISAPIVAPAPLPPPELADATVMDASPIVEAPLPSVPRLGVASSSGKSHLAPRPKSVPPVPSRTARGTATPPTTGKLKPSAFSTDQVTIAHAEPLCDSDHTVVD